MYISIYVRMRIHIRTVVVIIIIIISIMIIIITYIYTYIHAYIYIYIYISYIRWCPFADCPKGAFLTNCRKKPKLVLLCRLLALTVLRGHKSIRPPCRKPRTLLWDTCGMRLEAKTYVLLAPRMTIICCSIHHF